jgi:hypothetical protein
LIHVMDKKFGNMLYEAISEIDNGQREVGRCVRNLPNLFSVLGFFNNKLINPIEK